MPQQNWRETFRKKYGVNLYLYNPEFKNYTTCSKDVEADIETLLARVVERIPDKILINPHHKVYLKDIKTQLRSEFGIEEGNE